MSAERRIEELGLSLAENGKLPKARVGAEFSVEDGCRFARSAAMDLKAVVEVAP